MPQIPDSTACTPVEVEVQNLEGSVLLYVMENHADCSVHLPLRDMYRCKRLNDWTEKAFRKSGEISRWSRVGATIMALLYQIWLLPFSHRRIVQVTCLYSPGRNNVEYICNDDGTGTVKYTANEQRSRRTQTHGAPQIH